LKISNAYALSVLKFPAHRLLGFGHSNRVSFSSTDLYEFVNNYLAKPSHLILLVVIWCLLEVTQWKSKHGSFCVIIVIIILR
jgi:hypothetical protein